MAYTLNYAGGTITVNDGTLNTATSLSLPGRNYPGYGGPVDQNLVSLLESFAYYTSSPPNPITGQIWYDTNTSQLKVYDGASFVQISAVIASGSAPGSPAAGDLWYDTVALELNVYSGVAWTPVSPPAGLQSAAAVAITGGTIDGVTITNLTAPLAITDGGTSATTQSGARTALGLGTMAVINSPVPVANGGTGATTDSGARSALGLGTMSVINSPVPVANGGTGATNASAARTALGLGSIAVLNSPLGSDAGGTGSTSLTLNNVILGGGPGNPVQVVAPGSSGNVLTSNGTTWASTALSSQVPTVVAGLSYGAVGTYAFLAYQNVSSEINPGDTASGALLCPASTAFFDTGAPLSGTWRCLGYMPDPTPAPAYNGITLWVRIA